MSGPEDIRCPHCGSYNTDIGGAVSHGDGDFSDECYCEDCEETFEINTIWVDREGKEYDTEEEMWNAEASYDDEDIQGEYTE